MPDLIPLALIACCLVLFIASKRKGQSGKKLPSPPGAVPLLGHLPLLPAERPWTKLKEWSDQLGPIYSLKLGRQTVIVVSNYETASTLLDKRSAIYSSRPRLVMASDIVSRGQRLTFMPYNDLWKRERKYMNQLTSPAVSATYEPWQDVESTHLLKDLLRTPQQFWTHAQRYAGSLIMQVAFNKRALSSSEANISDMQAVLDDLTRTAVPGRYIVDSLPFLNMLPGFLAPWKAEGEAIYQRQRELFGRHLQDVKHDMQQGKAANCFVQQMLDIKGSGLTEDQISFLAGVMYGAGSDTTSVGIITFIMLMNVYPEAARKAQEELDRVIGRERLPDFKDQVELPYVRALIAEVQRYRPIIAGGLAHASTETDVFDGMVIPAGATIIPNAWAIHQDETLYPEPQLFKPERFLDTDGSFKGVLGDKAHFGFGWGRRACPGSYIAERSLYIVFSRILHVFEIKPAVDSHTGKPIAVDPDAYTSGFSSHPKKFRCQFVPREGMAKIVELHASTLGSD